MSSTKEKSAVGTAIPATEKDINNLPENIISANKEKINSHSENMTEILKSFCETLKLTDRGKNIVSIFLVTEPVGNQVYMRVAARVTYENGYTKDIDIGCDSGIAVVYDIARSLVYS